MLMLPVAVGCAGTGPGAVATSDAGASGISADPSGTFNGRVVFEGTRFESSLTLEGAGTRLSGSFRVFAPVALEGAVQAARIDDLLRIDVSYEGPRGCDGRIVGILDVLEDGRRLEGPVTVTDCRSEVPGHMSYRRGEGAS